MGQRLVDGVVRADQEICARARQLVGRRQHQRTHAGQVTVVQADHVVGQRMGVQGDFRVRVRPHALRAFRAQRAIAQRRALGRAGDDADVKRRGVHSEDSLFKARTWRAIWRKLSAIAACCEAGSCDRSSSSMAGPDTFHIWSRSARPLGVSRA
ncbi:hypothetical protein G6F65_021538 [Rhizopus arrhizus]|nr:hypothetical protein G6F65_021538 [Rhizopus arrhizus]